MSSFFTYWVNWKDWVPKWNHPVGVLILVVVEIIDKTLFGSVLASRGRFNCFTNLIPASLVFHKKVTDFLRFLIRFNSNLFLIKFTH